MSDGQRTRATDSQGREFMSRRAPDSISGPVPELSRFDQEAMRGNTPCSNARYCGNTATTTRAVAASGGHTLLCESCAAEHDENLS